LPFQAKPSAIDHDAVLAALPLARQHGAGLSRGLLAVEDLKPSSDLSSEILPSALFEHALGGGVEITERIGLQPVRENTKQQMSRQVGRGGLPEDDLPPRLQARGDRDRATARSRYRASSDPVVPDRF
jgi:hypothetical protein